MPDELLRRLEALGGVEPTPLDERRLDAMTVRVMSAIDGPTPTVDRRRTLALAVAAGLLALLVAGVVIATALVSGGDGSLRLDLADGVTIDLPDAAPAAGSAGDELPEGTVLSVAEGGNAIVDGRPLDAGTYVVVDGRIEALPDAGETTTTVTTSASRPSTSATTPGRATPPLTPPPRTILRTTTLPTTTLPTRTTTTIADPGRPPADDRRGALAPNTTTTNPNRTTTTTTTTGERPATTSTLAPTTTVLTTTTTIGDRGTTTTTVRDRPPGDTP